MARQLRGCSRLVYAPYTYDETENKVTFGAVKKFCEVKSISREISSDNEEVWADNKLQDTTYGGTAVTRTFSCMRVPKEVEADVLGYTTIKVGDRTLYGTPQDGSARRYFAFGYALHDGDASKPCELVWAFKGIVNSISQVANTIDRGTGSEGQEVNITFSAPDVPWTKTGKNDLDNSIDSADGELTVDIVNKWFAQVVTYDNAETTLQA